MVTRFTHWTDLPGNEIAPGVADLVKRQRKIEVVAAADYDALVELCKDVMLFNCPEELEDWQKQVSALVGIDISDSPAPL